MNATVLFRELGASVEEISMPLAAFSGIASRTISSVERVSIHPEWLRERPEDFHHNTRVAFYTGELIPAQVYYKAQKLRTLVRQQVLDALEQFDVLLQPTSSSHANVLDLTPGIRSKDQARKALVEGSFRGMYSLAGNPALSICCGFTSDDEGGVPLAMQIAGRPFDESTVFRAAYAYEQATEWHNRRPPI